MFAKNWISQVFLDSFMYCVGIIFLIFGVNIENSCIQHTMHWYTFCFLFYVRNFFKIRFPSNQKQFWPIHIINFQCLVIFFASERIYSERIFSLAQTFSFHVAIECVGLCFLTFATVDVNKNWNIYFKKGI